MKIYRHVIIELGVVGLDAFVSRLEAHCKGGWQHDTQLEQQVAGASVPVNPQFCFTLMGGRPYAPVSVWLVERGCRISVANVLSRTMNLSVVEFNEVLENFYNLVVEPAAAELHATARLTLGDAELHDLVPAQVAMKLVTFSHSANKKTSSTHPYDMERWLDFLTEIHATNHHLTPELLERWLFEDEGWPAEIASDLARQYEFSEELLGSYEHKRSA